jgi:hypothetical protein
LQKALNRRAKPNGERAARANSPVKNLHRCYRRPLCQQADTDNAPNCADCRGCVVAKQPRPPPRDSSNQLSTVGKVSLAQISVSMRARTYQRKLALEHILFGEIVVKDSFGHLRPHPRFHPRSCAVAVPIAHGARIHRRSVRCTRWHDRGKHPQRTNSAASLSMRGNHSRSAVSSRLRISTSTSWSIHAPCCFGQAIPVNPTAPAETAASASSLLPQSGQ